MVAPFIVIEGIDGSGKTSVSNYLTHILIKKGVSVILTTEPTNYETGIQIRRCLKGEEHDPKQLLFLFMADRCFHNTKISSSRNSGNVVITDRYSLSSWVYQSGAVNSNLLETLCTSEQFNLVPDILIYVTANVNTIVKRLESRGKLELFEATKMLESYKRRYESMIDNENTSRYFAKRVEIVSTENSIEDMHVQIDSIVESHWGLFEKFCYFTV
jgi:dTMP kinase